MSQLQIFARNLIASRMTGRTINVVAGRLLSADPAKPPRVDIQPARKSEP